MEQFSFHSYHIVLKSGIAANFLPWLALTSRALQFKYGLRFSLTLMDQGKSIELVFSCFSIESWSIVIDQSRARLTHDVSVDLAVVAYHS